MNKKVVGIIVGSVLAAGATLGLAGCGSSSSGPSLQDMTTWENTTLNDPGFQAVTAEFTGTPDLTDPATCSLDTHDLASFASNHPASPVDEQDWSATLNELSAGVSATCAGDTTTGLADVNQATASLKSFETAVDAAFPGFSLGTF